MKLLRIKCRIKVLEVSYPVDYKKDIIVQESNSYNQNKGHNTNLQEQEIEYP